MNFPAGISTRRLLGAGRQVVCLTASPHLPEPSDLFGGKVRSRPFAFDDPVAMAHSLRGVRVLYNTYWVRFDHPLFSYAQAERNSLALFEAAKKAGVERVVHVSITNADPDFPLEYFRRKGLVEDALAASGVSHAIVRPAVLFGEQGILINNIAWTLRRFPVWRKAYRNAPPLRLAARAPRQGRHAVLQ